MGNKTDVKFRMPGSEFKKPTPKLPLTMNEAVEIIKSKNLDPRVQEEILKRIMYYPSNSFNSVIRNLPTFVMDAQKKIKEEKDKEESL